MTDVLARYPSKSNPTKGYNVIHGGDGNIYCQCPAWKFQRGKGPYGRRCKHLDDYWRKENLRKEKLLPETVWDRLTAELYGEDELISLPLPPTKKRKPKGAAASVWDRLGKE